MSEIEVIEKAQSESESESEAEEEGSDMFDMSGMEEETNIAELFQTFFVGENSKNIVDTLQSLKDSVDTQNLIMKKIGALIEKHLSKSS